MTAAFARVAELEQLSRVLAGGPATLTPPAPAQSPGATPTTTFATALASAQAPSAVAATGGGNVPFGAEIDAAAQRHGIDPALLRALVRQESGFDPAARSSAGATGLTQLMPGTAAALGVDPTDPVQALDGGARYLREQLDRFGRDERLALAAYNAGPGAVQRHGGIPPYAETQNYVQKVLSFAAEYRGPAAPPAVASPATPAVGAGAPITPASTGALPYSTT